MSIKHPAPTQGEQPRQRAEEGEAAAAGAGAVARAAEQVQALRLRRGAQLCVAAVAVESGRDVGHQRDVVVQVEFEKQRLETSFSTFQASRVETGRFQAVGQQLDSTCTAPTAATSGTSVALSSSG